MAAGFTKVEGDLTKHIERDRYTVHFGLHCLLVTGTENHQQEKEYEEANPLQPLSVDVVDEEDDCESPKICAQ